MVLGFWESKSQRTCRGHHTQTNRGAESSVAGNKLASGYHIIIIIANYQRQTSSRKIALVVATPQHQRCSHSVCGPGHITHRSHSLFILLPYGRRLCCCTTRIWSSFFPKLLNSARPSIISNIPPPPLQNDQNAFPFITCHPSPSIPKSQIGRQCTGSRPRHRPVCTWIYKRYILT